MTEETQTPQAIQQLAEKRAELKALVWGSPWSKKSKEALAVSFGKTIASIWISEWRDDVVALYFVFTDGSGLKLSDKSEACFGRRYMSTDDDLQEFVGAKLLGADIKDGPSEFDEATEDEHDVQFLEIKTDNGVLTFVNHNEYNGYYAGFCIEAEIETPEEEGQHDLTRDPRKR